MERAGSFTSIPGWGGFIIGLTALAATAIAEPLTAWTPRLWLWTWLGEAIVASSIGAFTMVQKAKRSRTFLASGPARRFFISYFAPMIVGAILTTAMVRSGSYEPLPAMWLLLYGTAFVSSGAFYILDIPILGICFMILGVGAAFVPLGVGNLLLGAGFGGLHIAFGLIIARNYGG